MQAVPQKERKTVFVVTFIENSASIYEELRRQDPSCRTILASKNVYNFFSKYDESTILLFEPKKLKDFIVSIYHLATCKLVIVDNYYGFLSSIRFKKMLLACRCGMLPAPLNNLALKTPRS